MAAAVSTSSSALVGLVVGAEVVGASSVAGASVAFATAGPSSTAAVSVSTAGVVAASAAASVEEGNGIFVIESHVTMIRVNIQLLAMCTTLQPCP